MRKPPFFLKNPEWYVRNVDKNGMVKYELTDKAPKKAVESYKEFYKPIIVFDKSGRPIGIADA